MLVGVLYKRLRRSCSSDFVARVRASSHQTPQAPFGGWVLVGLGSLKVGRGTGIGRGTGSASSRGTGHGRGAGGGACFRVVAGQTVEVTQEPRCKCSSLVVSRLLSLVVSVQRFMFQCVCRLLSVFSYFIAQVSAMGFCAYQRLRRSSISDVVARAHASATSSLIVFYCRRRKIGSRSASGASNWWRSIPSLCSPMPWSWSRASWTRFALRGTS